MRSRAAVRVRRITLRVACAQLRARPVAQARAALADIVGAIRAARRYEAHLLVLPECSYPGYVLLSQHPYRQKIPSDVEALGVISREARRAKLAVVVGLARTQHNGLLRNEAIFLDARGNEVGSYAKTRLWNFDRHWFAAGRSVPVFQTELGTIGMMICADGRNPEIARTLVAQGAWLIADPTAWVGFGPSHDQIRNVQADYMLRVRSLENGVWIAAADKCGSELSAVHYAGRSQITAPDGSIVALAQPSDPQIICAEVRRTAPRPFIAALSAVERKALTSRPRSAQDQRRVPPRIWVGVYQNSRLGREKRGAIDAIAAQSVHALIRTSDSPAALARALDKAKGLRWAIISGENMLAPEPARAAALRGADLLVWYRPPESRMLVEVARTRAVENRVYVLVCSRSNDRSSACMVNPDGTIGASALVGVQSGFVTAVDTLLARRKEVVPGTQTFADRLPRAYRWLDGSRGVIVS